MLNKKLFLTAGFLAMLFSASNLRATEPEVGVTEHLGDTIPLDLWFLNEANDTVTLASLVDKPTIFTFVYFDCPGICSPLLSGVSDVVKNMDMELGKDYQIITISFNTKDTPEKAIQKKQNFVLKFSKENSDNWYYLTGEQENIKKITQATGFHYKPQGLDFAHPAVIVVVSPQGKITRYLYGMNFLPFDVKMAVIEAQKGIQRPTVNKILEMCFAYDPASRTYALQITRIVASIMIFFAVIIFAVLLIKGRRKLISNKA